MREKAIEQFAECAGLITLKTVKSLHMCLCGRKLRMYVKGPERNGLLNILHTLQEPRFVMGT